MRRHTHLSLLTRARLTVVSLALLAIPCPTGAQQDEGTSPPKAVTAWLAARAIPLTTVAAGSGFGDLERLAFADARLVAVGEATHGTSEFFRFKHRLIEFLVEQRGFSALAIEAGYVEGVAIDRFLQYGQGTAASAAIGTRFWTLSTVEVAEMFQWMRDYNADPTHPRKIRVYGVDMQFPDSASQHILQYFAQADPAAVPGVTTAVARFMALAGRAMYPQLSRSEQDADAARLAALIERFDTFRVSYIAVTGEEAWAVARQAAVVVSQAQHVWANPVQADEIRDAAMAENALWALDRTGANGRLMLWAHNFHVFSSPVNGYVTVGTHLRDALAQDLIVIGQHFDQGRFMAREGLPSLGQGYPIGELREFTVGPSAEESLNDALASPKLPLYLVDIRSASDDPAAGAWWRQPHQDRTIGAVYTHAFDSFLYAYNEAPRGYDLLVYVDTTTAARQLPR